MPSVDLGAEVTLRPTSLNPPQPCASAPPQHAPSPRTPGPARHALWPGQPATHPARRCPPALVQRPAPPRQQPQPTRPPALGACGSAPGPAQRTRAGQACWGQDRPSRNWSTRQRVRSTHLRGPRHGCSTQAITLAGPGRYDPWSRTPPALRSSATRRDRTLGPCWVRSARGPQRHERSPPAKRSGWSTSLQLRQLAQRLPADQIVVPKVGDTNPWVITPAARRRVITSPHHGPAEHPDPPRPITVDTAGLPCLRSPLDPAGEGERIIQPAPRRSRPSGAPSDGTIDAFQCLRASL